MNNMCCDIVIVSWNNANLIKAALDSIRCNTDIPYRLIIVDNASNEQTISLLRKAAHSQSYGPMLLIENNDNLGWVKAVNRGLREAEAPYVCIMNNDVITTSGWLRNMIRTTERLPDVGLANPRGDIPAENAKINDIEEYARRIAEREAGRFVELDFCSGYCLLIKKELIEKIGFFDEIYGMGYYEDNDYSRRAIQAGYHCIRCLDAFVLHLGGQSFNAMGTRKHELAAKNRSIFEQKWGRRKRYLILAKYQAADDLLEAARKGDVVYVVENDYVNTSSMSRQHENIKFLRPWISWFSEFFRSCC